MIEADSRNSDDVELAARGVGLAREGRGDGVERCGIRIVGSGGRLADDAARRYEACDVVDVAVGVIVLQTFVDPDDLLGTERFAQRGLGCFLRPAVAVRVQKRLPRRQDRAFAVVIDRAAFEHEVETADRRPGDACDVIADGCVIGQIVLAAPAVRSEAQRDDAFRRLRKDRSGIAQPDVAVLRRDDFRDVDRQGSVRGCLGFVAVGKHADLVAGDAQRADQRRHIAARRFEIIVPLSRIGGPCRPDRFLRRPFRRRYDGGVGRGRRHICP